jgi:hypothetical protein
MGFPVCYIIRHIASQIHLSQVAGAHRYGEIMLDRPAQLSRTNCTCIARNRKNGFIVFPSVTKELIKKIQSYRKLLNL